MFEIIDDKGVIHSGDEVEMEAIFDEMTSEGSEAQWDGDLKLVEIKRVVR